METSFFHKLVGFNPKTMKVRTEILAGVTTFLTMSYILAVNPDILSATGMDKGAVLRLLLLLRQLLPYLLLSWLNYLLRRRRVWD